MVHLMVKQAALIHGSRHDWAFRLLVPMPIQVAVSVAIERWLKAIDLVKLLG